MNIERFTTSMASNNTYLAYCPGAKVGIVVDPSYEIDEIVVHEIDAPGLTDPQLNLSAMVPPIIQSPPANIIVKDNDKIVIETKMGPLEFEVWHTPGHSPGHCCLKFHRGIFTGDLLFEGTVGRTDFPGCNPEDMKKSLMRLWDNIPETFEIFPGHNDTTTMAKEKQDNYLFCHLAVTGL